MVATVTFSDGERRVEELLKALELNGIRLEEESGDGSSFQKRYYCSNVCVDLLNDGSIRYLSDINDADGEDRFLKWLYKGGEVKIISESHFYGFILRNLRKGAINCQICIEQGSGRVVAARIIFNS
ncbi:MAG: hypothetical protein IKU45_03735 [Clostridia bacterium]|nr:hypothetical protein [Clostridia bacterium]